MHTVQDIIYKAAERLLNLTDSPQREACLLLAHALNKSYEDIYFAKQTLVTEEEETAFIALLERRLAREPLSKIRGYREFWSLPFRVTPDTLDPRPDSETLIEAVLDLFPDRNQALRILDLGTGTGCLLLSLLHEFPQATGVGIDRSEAAALIAQENAKNLNLESRAAFLVADWGQAINGVFDIIISNPPYIGQKEVLPIEVKAYDPGLALYAGEDGLDAYRTLAQDISSLASPKSKLILELGASQLDDVISIFFKWIPIKVTTDLQGKKRCIAFCMKSMPVD